MDRTEAPASPRSQSRLSPILLWVLLAALVFRVVTAVMDRGGPDGTGLVRWQPRGTAPARAGSLGKPILYEFTAAWCGPCKLLDRDWDDAAVADRVNAAFVPVRVVDRMREDGKNAPEVAELERRYEISGFPTLVVAAPDGRLVAKHEGYRGRQALLEFLGSALSRPAEADPRL
jgi:thiol-disulfide isomerase/thioredoxin